MKSDIRKDLIKPFYAPMRICYLIDRLDLGGTESQLLKLMNSFHRDRVIPHLCLLNGEDERSRSLEPAHIPTLRLNVRSLASWNCLRKGRKFIAFLKQHKIELLQTYFVDSATFGVPLAKLAGVPVVVKSRRDLIFYQSWKQRYLSRPLDRIFNRLFVDEYLVNCESCGEAVALQEGVSPSVINVIENALDLALFQQFENADDTSVHIRGHRVGMVAMLRPEKNPLLMIEAARRLQIKYPDLEVLLAGSGSEQSRLERMIDEHQLSRSIKILGEVTDIPKFLASIDVAVLCSDVEGLSNAVIEYMAAARPIVVTAVGGNRELINHEHNGLLVPANNAVALADAIGRLFDDRVLAKRLGQQARQDVKQRFELQSIVSRYENFYAKLLRPQHPLDMNGSLLNSLPSRHSNWNISNPSP